MRESRIGRALYGLFVPLRESRIRRDLLDRAADIGRAEERMTLRHDLRRIDAQLARLYTDDERALWWHRPHPQLGGESAIVALLSGRGGEVGQIVERLDSSAFI